MKGNYMKTESSNAKPVPKSLFYILMSMIGIGIVAVVLRMAGLI